MAARRASRRSRRRFAPSSPRPPILPPTTSSRMPPSFGPIFMLTPETSPHGRHARLDGVDPRGGGRRDLRLVLLAHGRDALSIFAAGGRLHPELAANPAAHGRGGSAERRTLSAVVP